MIVGKGLLANAFREIGHDADGTLIFASGVSNSSETDDRAFDREAELLRIHLDLGFQHFVYFSSFGVTTGEHSKYLEHKARMEALVSRHPGGVTFRLPQVVGRGGNPNTLINALAFNIKHRMSFKVWARAERNLVDIEHVVDLVNHITPSVGRQIIPITSERSLSILEIVEILEMILGETAVYTTVERGVPMIPDTSMIADAARHLKIDLGGEYAQNVLQKYFSKSN